MNKNIEEYIMQKVEEDKVKMKKFNRDEINQMIINGKKLKKKRIHRNIALATCVFIVSILVVTIIINTNRPNYNNVSITAKDENDISTKTFFINYDSDILIDISDIEVLKNAAEQIVIAKVDKIEGCTNYSEGLGMYTRINTLGNIEILKVLKGNINVGAKVPFIRGGGIISYNDYEKGVINGDREQVPNTYEYVVEKRKGDIDIEEGKIYLMFLHYDIYNQRYEIIANQYGLREYDESNKLVKNNITNKFENIEMILK